MWKSEKAGGGGDKKRFQYSTDPSGQEILSLRALQGHSGRNPIDPSLHYNVLISNNFFENIYHIGCAINLRSIMNSGLIPGGQNVSKRQTAFFASTKNTELRTKLSWKLRVLHGTSRKREKHQNTVYEVGIKLAQQKGVKFYPTRSNAIILYDTLSAYCIPNAIMMETGQIMYEKVYAVTSSSSEDFFFFGNWMKELGSEVVGGSEDSQQTQSRSKHQ